MGDAPSRGGEHPADPDAPADVGPLPKEPDPPKTQSSAAS